MAQRDYTYSEEEALRKHTHAHTRAHTHEGLPISFGLQGVGGQSQRLAAHSWVTGQESPCYEPCADSTCSGLQVQEGLAECRGEA